jgi:DHA3 family multidrug efflux protein-like MFS transporter
MAPVTEFVVIPFMTDGAGARAIGGWFGTGADRGIALVFVVTGLIGLVVVLLALGSPAYRRLSAAYAAARDDAPVRAEEPAPPSGAGLTAVPTPAAAVSGV